MTDTSAYTDIMFGIFHLLGFQFSPPDRHRRLALLARRRASRLRAAQRALAAQRVNTALIAEHSEDLLRLVGSLKLGTVLASGMIRTLQTKDRPTKRARARGQPHARQ